MAAKLSVYILLSFPLAAPDTLAIFDKMGDEILDQAAYMVSNKIVDPTRPIPTYTSIKPKMSGTPFDDSNYISFDLVKAVCETFDTCQSTVQAAYSGGSTVPVPPPAPAINTQILNTWAAYALTSHPLSGFDVSNAMLILMVSGISNFMFNSYF